MQRFALLFATSCLLFGTSAVHAVLIPGGNGHLYGTTPFGSWTTAEAYAVSQGGHLVTIDDAVENEFIRTTFLTGPGAAEDFWIGLYAPSGDWSVDANYVWASGSSSTYRNWRTGEPNEGSPFDGEEDRYTAINWLQTGNAEWDNYPNSVYRQPRGIFEVVPEPSSATLALGGVLLSALLARRRTRPATS